MKKTLTILGLLLLTATTTTLWQSCKKSSSNSTSSSGVVALSIQTGAQTILPGGSLPYSAVLVDKSGKTSTPSSITWSIASVGGSSIGSFSGSTFTATGTGYGTITASTTVNGTTLTASVPVGIYAPTVFAVVPSAVIWTTGAGTIPLTPVYIGTGTTSYGYTSSDATIASVDASGVITFNKTGSCVITVTASGLMGNPSVQVPVLVVGMPSVSLPVVRVAVNPAAAQIFRNENTTLTATAYDGSGAQVSGSATWAVQDASIASVDQSGKVTGLSLGKTVVTATISGITGQAEVDVLPDTAIIVTPFWASLAPSATKQFTATTYKVNHSDKSLSIITPNPTLNWTIPTYGIPVFDIATVSSTGLVTMKSTATLGLATFVMAAASSPTIEPGVAMLSVSDCNCGTTTPGVTHIGLTSPTTVNLSLMTNPTANIIAAALDATNTPVTGATLTYCTDNMAACAVDASGTITATGPGSAIVTICNGGVSTTITVNVTL